MAARIGHQVAVRGSRLMGAVPDSASQAALSAM